MSPKILEGTGHRQSSDQLAQIEVHVQGQLCGAVREFRLLPCESGVLLRGQARSFYAKQLAQHAVMATTDLPIAANEIAVCRG